VAELGAAFLCAELGITPEVRQDHADYLGHWLTVFKEDKRAIFSAAAHAQRAADYLNGLQQQEVSRAAEEGRGHAPLFHFSALGLRPSLRTVSGPFDPVQKLVSQARSCH
jgi:hypothetical protein